jgi:hypothetical protein
LWGNINSATTTAFAASSPADSARRDVHISAQGTHCTCKGNFRNAFPRVTDETAMKKTNRIIPDLVLQLGHFSRDEHSLAGCENLADTKTLNASKQHYHKKSTDFSFAVNLTQS